MIRYRTWPLFLTVFADLSVLTAGAGYYAYRIGQKALAEVAAIHEAHRRKNNHLNRLEGLVLQSALLVRDVAYRGGVGAGGPWRREFSLLRAAVDAQLEGLGREFGSPPPELFERLRGGLEEYWASQEALLSKLRDPRSHLDPEYLRRELVPRRLAVFAVAEEIDRVSRAGLQDEAAKTGESFRRSGRVLRNLVAVAGTLAFGVAALAAFRLWRLERQWERERERAEEASEALRRLSQEVVRAQEEERRSLSRELHDEVGQALTALRLELAGLEPPAAGDVGRIEEAKALAESVLRTVRNLALGLRPSMLDDLGLGPALGWQVREFSRHSGIPVELDCDPDLGNLPEPIRTCLYRVAQEALTNCARHARAKAVGVSVRRGAGVVTLTVEDDGVGFGAAERRGSGFGLLGMEERVRELGGRFSVLSRPYRGTRLSAELPLGEEGQS